MYQLIVAFRCARTASLLFVGLAEFCGREFVCAYMDTAEVTARIAAAKLLWIFF